MAIAKKNNAAIEFQSIAEWKAAYFPEDDHEESYVDEFKSHPNDLAVRLASAAIDKLIGKSV